MQSGLIKTAPGRFGHDFLQVGRLDKVKNVFGQTHCVSAIEIRKVFQHFAWTDSNKLLVMGCYDLLTLGKKMTKKVISVIHYKKTVMAK